MRTREGDMNCSRRIPEKELKKLWGLAAGRCSLCHDKVLPLINNNADVLGDMAHIIAFKKDGARGDEDCEYDNAYSNLILVCPKCHRTIDHNPEKYTKEVLLMEKQTWEARVEAALDVAYKTKSEALGMMVALLEENHAVWLHCGPESVIAKRDPGSNMADYWTLRKLDTIVPNNRKLIRIGDTFLGEMPDKLRLLFSRFKEHARMFEQGCYSRIDNPLRFPKGFDKELKRYAVQ